MTATCLACLTPPGTAALASLALRGPAAWDLVRHLARRELPQSPQPGRFWLTRLGDAGRGEADDVVVAVKQMLPEPWVELHCHGGREVVRMLEDLFAARGGEIREWQQLESQSSADPLRNAALPVLSKALTARTAGIALDQYRGALARAIADTCAALQRGDSPEADRLLAQLDRHADVGCHLQSPWRVVIAGAPNVGKSSLVNALAGFQRSIVSPTPGTTRDVVTTILALDGWPVEVADTAGLWDTDAPLDRAGIARANEAIGAADLCLWVLDASAPPVWPPANLAEARCVLNKTDLPPAWPQESVDAVRISAHTGTGLAELCAAIVQWLVPEAPPAGAGVPFTPRLAIAIGAIRDLTRAGREAEALGKLENLGRECD